MTNEEMIEKLEQDGLSALSDMEFITNALEENTKLKAEIEEYNKALTTWNNANNEMLKFNQELKDEIELLKSTISEMETTTAQEDDLK